MVTIKLKILMLSIVLVTFINMGCGINNQQTTTKENQSGNPLITNHYKLYEEIQVGKQTLLISDIQTTQKIERTSYITKQTQNLFVVMRIRITNNDEQTTYYDPALLNIKDSTGRVFPCSDESDFYLNSHSYFFFQPVSPSESKIGDVFFEIPLNAKELTLEVSSSSEWANRENVEIKLGQWLNKS